MSLTVYWWQLNFQKWLWYIKAWRKAAVTYQKLVFVILILDYCSKNSISKLILLLTYLGWNIKSPVVVLVGLCSTLIVMEGRWRSPSSIFCLLILSFTCDSKPLFNTGALYFMDVPKIKEYGYSESNRGLGYYDPNPSEYILIL